MSNLQSNLPTTIGQPEQYPLAAQSIRASPDLPQTNTKRFPSQRMSTNPPKKRPSTDTLVLLGSDPFRQTYHWEGPQPGTVWETAAGNLFGWLMRWTEPEEGEEVVDEDGRPIYYLVDPNTQECWVAKDGSGVVVVVDKTSGMEVLRIKMELAHWYKENLIGSLEELRGRTSPYAFAAAVMRGEVW